MNLILCGLPGAGKSVVGKLIAEHWKRPFVDTDTLIEERYRDLKNRELNCRLIHSREGELFFRKLEQEVVASLVIYKNYVIATGGGVVVLPENRPLLKSAGKILYLKAQESVLLKRLLQLGTPSYLCKQDPMASFEAIVKERMPLYEQLCDLVIDTGNRTPEQVVEMISCFYT